MPAFDGAFRIGSDGGMHLTSIIASNVTIDFPIYGASHRSLRQTLFARTGGLIRHEGAGRQQLSLIHI